MPRLVPFELRDGKRLRIDGREYVLSRCLPPGPTVCITDVADQSCKTITRDEIALLVVYEKADFVFDEVQEDEADDAEAEPPGVIDIARLSLHRLVDWQFKLFLIKAMLPNARHRPTGAFFRCAYAESCERLLQLAALIGIEDFNPWSASTIYKDMLRFRKSKFELSAIQVKGLKYCPHETPDQSKRLLGELAKQFLLKNPTWNKQAIYEAIEAHARQSPTGDAHPVPSKLQK